MSGIARLALLTLLCSVAVAAGAALLRSPYLAPLAPIPAQPFAAVRPPVWGDATDTAIRRMQARTATQPTDPQAYAAHAQLGTLYLQKVRETGDPSLYAQAEAALRASLALLPENPLAAVGMGGLHLARHEFQEALHWGELARSNFPRLPAAHGVIADALLELGRYAAAVDAIQQMVDLRPDLPSLSRVSYARELHGDLPGAIDAMRRAVDAGNPANEGTSWARIHLGHLLLLTGDLDAADAEYQRTLDALPDYVHGLAGRARVAAARGDLQNAIRLYERAQDVLPLAEYAIALGDAYRESGNRAAAARQEELVRVIARLQRAAGVDVNLEMALWEADRAAAEGDTGALLATLATARAQYELRPESIHAADALAWALFRAGRAEAALPYARDALRLGTPDPILLYHAGAIAAAAGQVDMAREYLGRALSPTPHFSVRYAAHARRLLTQLSAQ